MRTCEDYLRDVYEYLFKEKKMPEIKTFHNPTLEKSVSPGAYWYLSDFPSRQNGGHFSRAEWDMVVTLTKKQRPFKPGDKVYVPNSWSQPEYFTVISVYAPSREVWVHETDDPSQTNFFYPEELTHVEEV